MGFALSVVNGNPKPSTAMPAKYCLCLKSADGHYDKFGWIDSAPDAANCLHHARNVASDMGEWVLIRASFEEVGL